MKKILIILALIFCFAQTAQAAQRELDYSSFRLLPVLHEGRIKPLDTYARIKLLEFSGRKTINGKTALEWLAESLFDPTEATELPLFEINSPTLKDHLDLDKKKNHFALTEIVPALKPHADEIATLLAADEKTLTQEQVALLDLHQKILSYSELLRTFSAILPLNIDLPGPYITNKPENIYLDFVNATPKVHKEVQALVKKKGSDPAKYNDEEKRLANFAYALEDIEAGGSQNDELKIIYDNGEWFSPWQLIKLKRSGSGTWQNMAKAYRENNAYYWRKATQEAHPPGSPDLRLKLERVYNSIEPFHTAFGFYVLGLIILMVEIQRKTNRPLFPLICGGAGFFIQASGLASRIYILERPPVGTLYESLLFVSLICVLAAGILYYRRKDFAPLFSGFGSGALLLFIAPFLLTQGESMEMLVAVLNTNFWLGTHVLCITAGYGISILTAFLAHGYLIARIKNISIEILMPLQTGIYQTSLVALLFTAIGTILGGIWADQSWGRFWGWDPKENGALLIVLWIIWMQHGRLAGKMNSLAFIVSAAFLNVIVALAWFGVNLLSVGLHSYGFINGIAWALAAFCILETILIAGLWKLNVKKTNNVPA